MGYAAFIDKAVSFATEFGLKYKPGWPIRLPSRSVWKAVKAIGLILPSKPKKWKADWPI
jgi:hypothetical protein